MRGAFDDQCNDAVRRAGGVHTEAGGESHEAERTAARLSGVVICGEGGDAGNNEGQTKAVEGTPDHGLQWASCFIPGEGGARRTALPPIRCSSASLEATASLFRARWP